MPLVGLQLGGEQLSNRQFVMVDSFAAMLSISCGFRVHARCRPAAASLAG